MPSTKSLEQDQDHRPDGQIWSDHITNLESIRDAQTAAGEPHVMRTRYARLANEKPEDFQALIALDETQPPAGHVGEVATEHLVSRQ